MISSNYFNKTLDEIYNEVWQLVTQTNNNRLEYILFSAVKSWCRKLQLSDDATIYISNTSENLQDFTNDIWSRWKAETGFLTKEDSDFKKSINNYVGKKMKQNINDMKFLLLFGFLITAVGYAFYLLNQQSTQKEDSLKQRQSSLVPLPHSSQAKESLVLVLVINAGREDILQTLKTNSRITTNQSDSLYRATQALWIGSKGDFNSEFESWFYSKHAASDVESEYDVYFVQIELHQDDSGFKRDVSQLDRIDAFHRLPDNSGKVEVSDRLPSKAYENKLLYSR